MAGVGCSAAGSTASAATRPPSAWLSPLQKTNSPSSHKTLWLLSPPAPNLEDRFICGIRHQLGGLGREATFRGWHEKGFKEKVYVVVAIYERGDSQKRANQISGDRRRTATRFRRPVGTACGFCAGWVQAKCGPRTDSRRCLNAVPCMARRRWFGGRLHPLSEGGTRRVQRESLCRGGDLRKGRLPRSAQIRFLEIGGGPRRASGDQWERLVVFVPGGCRRNAGLGP